MRYRPHLFATLVAGPAILLAACGGDGGANYDVDRGDDDFDLAAMSLRESDVPEDYLEQDQVAFNNDEWAEVLDEVDPEAKLRQLEAVGRVRNSITIFARENPLEHLGRPYQFSSHSTLYATAEQAIDSVNQFCDVPIDENNPREDFDVPKLGDQATGFSVSEQLDNFGESIDTIVCFRTGRLVHAVVQSGLEGTHDQQLSIDLAKKMLQNVDAYFDGEPLPEEEATDEPEG